jgi:hypothetical protein
MMSNRTFTSDFYEYFYDEECARELWPLGVREGVSGVDYINHAFSIFFSPLKMESLVLDFLADCFLIMLLQLGGIVLPSQGDTWSIVLWVVVCALLLLQIFAVVLAVGLIIIAFLSLRVKLSPCAVMWLYDIQFIDITTIPVLCLHPIIVSRLFILAICK